MIHGGSFRHPPFGEILRHNLFENKETVVLTFLKQLFYRRIQICLLFNSFFLSLLFGR